MRDRLRILHRRTRLAVFPVLLLAFPAAADVRPAQDATFQASVSRTELAMGEQLRVDFQLSGTQSGTNFRPPDFRDFLVLSGPNQSTNFQMINGAVSTSVTFSYILQPGREGELTIGAATVEYRGKKHSTAPVTVRVGKSAPGAARQPAGGGADQGADEIAGNLLLRVELDKTDVYQGEQVTATYRIYTRVNVVNYNMARIPTFTGFWSEEIEVPQQIQLTTEVLDGKQYRVGLLKKVALFPQREGTLEIGPMDVECVVQLQARRRSNDIFDQFFNDPFFGRARNVTATVGTKARTVTVRPLPREGAPKDFGGAVGRFTLQAAPDRESAEVNDPITFRVSVRGTGNIKLLEPPRLQTTPDIDVYDPKITDRMDKSGDRIAGSRTFEYLMIPRHAGRQRIPPVEFSYFDPGKRRYETLRTPEFIIPVAKGSARAELPTAGPGREDVKLLGEDIRFIRSDDLSLSRRDEKFAGSGLFYLLAVTPVAFFGVFLVLMRRRERILGDIAGLRARKARSVAQKRLRHAKHLLGRGAGEEFHTEISRALWGYCSDRLGMAPAGLSVGSVRSALEAKGASAAAAGEFASIIDRCDFARFSPAAESGEMKELYGRAEKLISELEEGLK